jgi:ribosomal protein RSM22 (predicted rRNA methylase)
MELPAALRLGVDAILDGVPLGDIRDAARTLSQRYRAEIRDGRLHMNADLTVRAYLATRLPATFAAVSASLTATRDAFPDLRIQSMLDVGSGPGTALWAAASVWPELERSTLLEASEHARKTGQQLARGLIGVEASWLAGDATIDLSTLQQHDLVTCAYVLDEITPASLPKLIERLWHLTGEMLVIVEPGTPAGWQRILAARAQLIEAGAQIIAPCAHHAPCPIVAPDWCHFSRRVARSRVHRLAKEADVPWEDEKFIYLAASRHAPVARESRVLAPARSGSGRAQLKLCRPDGQVETRMFTKRDGPVFKEARRADWGDTIDEQTPD